MNTAIEQLEKRLQKLEQLRSERKTWLNDLITPIETRFEELAKMRHEKNVIAVTNIVRFPIEKRLTNR